MNKSGIAALAAAGGLVVGALVGPHVPGLAADGGGEKAGNGALADRIAVEDLVTRYYGNFGRTDAAEAFGTYYTEDAVFDVNGIVSTGRAEIACRPDQQRPDVAGLQRGISLQHQGRHAADPGGRGEADPPLRQPQRAGEQHRHRPDGLLHRPLPHRG